MTADDFKRELASRFDGARRRGQWVLDVTSGDVHRRVGDYPGRDHRMPLACAVMRAAMRPGDVIISAPPRGNGASLRIRYQLGTA